MCEVLASGERFRGRWGRLLSAGEVNTREERRGTLTSWRHTATSVRMLAPRDRRVDVRRRLSSREEAVPASYPTAHPDWRRSEPLQPLDLCDDARVFVFEFDGAPPFEDQFCKQFTFRIGQKVWTSTGIQG